MYKVIVFSALSMVLSGCVYSHTWHHQRLEGNRCYSLIDNGDSSSFETNLNVEYERHLFTDEAGFGFYCCMNPLEALVQLPCVLLTELPFYWLWEKDYVYKVPIKYDKSLKVENERVEGLWERLTWEDGCSPGVTNVVCATIKKLDEYSGKADVSIAHYKGGVKIREVDLEPVVKRLSHRLQTFDGRHIYIWNQFDVASYLYGYFRHGKAARTSWCPILLELDLETGVVKRLVWTEYNTLYHSEEVEMKRRK